MKNMHEILAKLSSVGVEGADTAVEQVKKLNNISEKVDLEDVTNEGRCETRGNTNYCDGKPIGPVSDPDGGSAEPIKNEAEEENEIVSLANTMKDFEPDTDTVGIKTADDDHEVGIAGSVDINDADLEEQRVDDILPTVIKALAKIGAASAAMGNDNDETVEEDVNIEGMDEIHDHLVNVARHINDGEYGDMYGDPDINKVMAMVQAGKIEAAAEEFVNSFSDQDGGESSAADGIYADLVSDLKHMTVQEESDVEEGNEFSGALAKAKASGANEFEVDGKKYKVEEADVEEETVRKPIRFDSKQSMPSIMKYANQSDVSNALAKAAGVDSEEVYFDDADLVYGDKTVVPSCGVDDNCTFGDAVKALKKMRESVEEAAKPDFADIDGDGDKEESMKKAAKDKEEDKEEKVEETTSSGSVATSTEAPKSNGVYGKSVYEDAVEAEIESINESMNVSMNVDTNGQQNLTVSAQDDDAAKLGELLKMAGLFQSSGYDTPCETCGKVHEGECTMEDYANEPNEQTQDTEFVTDTVSGGLNRPKKQVNPNNPGDNPLAMQGLGKTAVDLTDSIREGLDNLYKQYKG